MASTIQDLVDSIAPRQDFLERPLETSKPLEKKILDGVQRLGESNLTFVEVLELDGKKVLYSYSLIQDLGAKLEKLCNLLDLIWVLSQQGLCDFRVTYEFLEDLFEIETIDFCLSFWPFLEHRETRIARNLNGARKPGTDLIRFLNSLLRRLSKTHHSAFAGRILILLGKAFPLSERSGVNQRGEFDTDNVTEWDHSADNEEADVYGRFWRLQKTFMDPVQLLSHPEEQRIFKDDLTVILKELKDVKSVSEMLIASMALSGDETVPSDVTAAGTQVEKISFSPKWHTSPALFNLELQDSVFRKTIYSQIYFLCDFLQNQKNTGGRAPIVNKSLIYASNISPEFSQFLEEIQGSIARTGGAVIGADNAFSRSLKIVVTRDHNWQRWKEQNTPSFEIIKVTNDELKSTADQSTKLRGVKRPHVFSMGIASMSKIQRTKTGIELLKAAEKVSAPTFAELQEENAGQEKTELASSKEWRALRAARTQGMWVKSKGR
ncbi:THO complex, subunit THOC1 [Limtongia smithiae]|uniref:THO complex, subunit THOC1 n=1 Tax=Limtongia smithiae TaxID=1125753 RepID=UPI0034CE06CF